MSDDNIWINGDLYQRRKTVNLSASDDLVAQFKADIAEVVMASTPTAGNPPPTQEFASVSADFVWYGWLTLDEDQIAMLITNQIKADRFDKAQVALVCRCKQTLVNKLAKPALAAHEAAIPKAEGSTDG